MKRWLFVLIALGSATPAAAAELPVCQALEAMRADAHDSHQPVRIAVFNTEPMTMACRRGQPVAAIAFCDATVSELGLEGMHRFPWLIRDCLNQTGLPAYTEQVDQQTMMKNRKKIIHLWAGWHDGARIDIQFKSADRSSTHDRYSDYFGTYEMTLWYP